MSLDSCELDTTPNTKPIWESFMNKSVITAVKPAFNVLEGHSAIAQFKTSAPLSAQAEVMVRVEGWGASPSEDFGTLMFSTNGRDFAPVQNGRVTLPAGTTEFFLAVRTRTDTNAAEGIERLAFVVAQTPESASVLDGSYYVSSVVSVVDASPVPPTITGRDKAVVEGQFAVGAFTLDGTLGTTATVKVRVEGYSATLEEDTTGALQVRVNGSGSWKDVEGGTVTLEPGTERFELRVATKTDPITEAHETLNFVVEQTDALFTNSYYVNSLITIVDSANATAVSAVPVGGPRITARPFNVEEGQFAASTFKLDAPLPASAKVAVRVEGHSATLGSDTSGALQVRINGSGSWADVSSDGMVTLPAGATSFELRVATTADNATEQPETLNFVVAQVDGSFRDSYYVSSLATLFDQGTLPAASSDPMEDGGEESVPDEQGEEEPEEGDDASAPSDEIDPDDIHAADPLSAGGSSGSGSGSTSGAASGGSSGSVGSTGGNTTTTTGPAPTPQQSKTFSVSEVGGVISFGGTAKGAITVTIAADGIATFAREGISAASSVTGIATKLIDSDDDDAMFNIIGTSGNDTLRFRVDEDLKELFLTGSFGTGADRVFLVLADDPDNLHDLEFVSNLSLAGDDDTIGVVFSQGDDYLVFDQDSTFDGFESLLIRGDFNNVADISLVTDPSAQLIGTYVVGQYVLDGGGDLR